MRLRPLTRILGVPTREPNLGASSTSPRTVRFLPEIGEDVYQELATVVAEADDPRSLRRDLTAYAVRAGRRGKKGTPERAAALVLVDLLRQEWDVFADRAGCIWISAVGGDGRAGERVGEAKERVRRALQEFRGVQLSDPAVISFLRNMERPRSLGGERVSVLDLVDDGHALALALADAGRVPPSKRGRALDRIIRPVLQVATPDQQCEHTGLALYDIWRYFRHTWSLEYRPVPGRSLAYLVRNAARPKAPIMGIASIANAAMQMRVRDDWVGWSTNAVIESLKSAPSEWPERRRALMAALRAAIEQIRSDDLIRDAGKSASGEELERRLRAIGSAARNERTKNLRSHKGIDAEHGAPSRALPLNADGSVDWRTASEDDLFTAKRAETLAGLLYALRVVKGLPRTGQRAAASAEDRQVRQALTIAAREIRKIGLSSRLMDVNVCGAAPPYRDLLVGKLVALAMGSREVSDAYRARYQGQVSEIASKLAARPISREPDLCLLTTTSLYSAVASQYNRLRLTVDAPDGEATALAWQELGLTEGWGTTHFSEATMDAFRDLSILKTGARNVNNRFGEGQSPRMRQAREALKLLELDDDVYLKHRHARRVYALELSGDARADLRLNRPSTALRPEFAVIARGWRDRWLSQRILNPDVRGRVAEQGPLTVQAELTAADTEPQLSLPLGSVSPRQPDRPVVKWRGVMPVKSNPQLIQSLYRALGACADHHSEENIKLLHIPTPADKFIAEHATGRVVFVTGNPGDGKTHLLRHLAPKLQSAKVKVLLDANELPNEEIVAAISHAERTKRQGLAIAINEGILEQLLRENRDAKWARIVGAQLHSPLVYGDAPDDDRDERFLVVDLSLRNNLAPDVVRAALGRLLSLAGPCASCPGASSCSLLANAERLQKLETVERLVRLLEEVGRLGVHATMRELQGFLAFMLMGGKGCSDEQQAVVPYWVHAFAGGEGILFDAVRNFSPDRVTHPILDDELWRRADRPEHWLLPWARPVAAETSLAERVEALREAKRRALFEHQRGALLLRSSSQVDQELLDLPAGGSAVRRIIARINQFFDRSDPETNLLHLWMTHRYDAKAPRYAAAAQHVELSRFQLLVPRLRPMLRAAFPDYHADHAVLVADRMDPRSEGLRVDRALVEALHAAEHGLPSSFRRGEPEARISSFISRLARHQGEISEQDQIEVRLVDRDIGKSVVVNVDVDGRRFVRR